MKLYMSDCKSALPRLLSSFTVLCCVVYCWQYYCSHPRLPAHLSLIPRPPPTSLHHQPHSTTNLTPSLLPTSFPAHYQPHSHATNLIPQPHDQPTTASFPGLQQLHYQVTLPVSLTGFQQAFAHNTTGKGSPEFQVALITFSLPVMLTSSLELRLRYRVHFRAG